MPTAYILVGVPGSGKSTWVESQDWINDCCIVSTDHWVEQESQRQGKTYSEVFENFMPSAVKLMTKAVVKAREANKDIIWDQTSTTVLSRKKKFNMLPNYNHIAVVFKTPLASELLQRLDSRLGKNVPWTVVSGMIDNFEMPTEQEGFKEIWYT
jgi:predicted kinase